MEKEKKLNKANKGIHEADSEYRKEMLKFYSLEQKHNEEKMRREEDFNEKLKEMKANKEKQYDEERAEIKEKRQMMRSQFEKEKKSLQNEIKVMENEYSKVLSETLTNKRAFFRVENLLASSMAIQKKTKESEDKLDNEVRYK